MDICVSFCSLSFLLFSNYNTYNLYGMSYICCSWNFLILINWTKFNTKLMINIFNSSLNSLNLRILIFNFMDEKNYKWILNNSK